jgi:hypothetical protein
MIMGDISVMSVSYYRSSLCIAPAPLARAAGLLAAPPDPAPAGNTKCRGTSKMVDGSISHENRAAGIDFHPSMYEATLHGGVI